MDCVTDNVVYGIACNRCSKIVHVIETGRPLYGHESYRDKESHYHYKKNSTIYRRIRESSWIYRTDTQINELNKRD